MKTWNIGNTTVRNPERIREVLILFNSKMIGRPFGKKEQTEFQGYMIDSGLVDSDRRTGDDGARKFASAFKQLGLVTDWSKGKQWELTSVGRHMIESPNMGPNIFLRQLLKYQIPSPLEKTGTDGFNLRPYRLFLKFLHRAYIENLIGLTKIEIGLYVITTLTEDSRDFESSFSKIKEFRSLYNSKYGNVQKSAFSAEHLRSVANSLELMPHTLLDYADSNSRYALTSGILTLKGNKITISDSRMAFVSSTLSDNSQLSSDNEYLEKFYDPTSPLLPSDNASFLKEETTKLVSQINSIAELSGEYAVLPPPPKESTVLPLQEYELVLRKELRRLREIEFYRNQNKKESLVEIESLLEDIRDNNLVGGLVYAPAFFEWAIWRLFLAINHIVGSVSNTRGFQIDEDMQPLHHAKGGAADLKFTYEDYILICEMTLATGSRQFAMEGEPVTRHVFKVIKENGTKPVYGLFVAKKIDPNTVDAFHNARYWDNWESYITTPVVSVEIDHILSLVRSMQREMVTTAKIRGLFDNILDSQKNYSNGPEWYQSYNKSLTKQFE